MRSPENHLARAVTSSLVRTLGPELASEDTLIRVSQFADFQSNVSLSLAKRFGRSPRQLAESLVAALDLDEVCSEISVSGPGFINFTLRDPWMASRVERAAEDDRLGVERGERQTIVIDYSAPNVAKEMHVGHLRTTIVGDALARTLEWLGHDVIRQNHIGDWGTPFGMLIEHLVDVGGSSAESHQLESEPNLFYQAARQRFDSDQEFAARSRQRVVLLQSGDASTLAHWQVLIARSRFYFDRIYRTLNVSLTDADIAGESTYNAQLPEVCDELERRGIARVSDGALCVFLDGYLGREGTPTPLIVRKSDGGYGYATSDLATIKHRVENLGADRILYVVGATQSLHLRMVIETARKAGWLPPTVEVVHVQIGNVLGADRKLLRTRSGAPLMLEALLSDAIDSARGVLEESRPELPGEIRDTIAAQVGIGAVKYADLSVAHDSEYVFDLDRMTMLTGNTGPYLQYAVSRTNALLRTASAGWRGSPVLLGGPAERDLALALLAYGPSVEEVGVTLEPHRLCEYLYRLARCFSVFYEECPIFVATDPALRDSRLVLTDLVRRVLTHGLDLLGIEAPDQM